MSVLESLSAYIVSQSSTTFRMAASTGSQVPIWLGGAFPETPATAVTVRETGGFPPVATLGSTVPLAIRPSVQVIVRSTSYTTARTHAQTIWNTLFGAVETNFPTTAGSTTTTRYHWSSPNQEPIDLGQDGKQRSLVSCNFNLTKAPA